MVELRHKLRQINKKKSEIKFYEDSDEEDFEEVPLDSNIAELSFMKSNLLQEKSELEKSKEMETEKSPKETKPVAQSTQGGVFKIEQQFFPLLIPI